MARNARTDNFVDIDISTLDDMSLDLGLPDDDEFEDLSMDLGLGDLFGDYKADDLFAVEVVPIEDSVSKLESIVELNIAYDRSTRHVSDRGKNDRSKRAVDRILAKIKTVDNIEIIVKEHKRLNSTISGHLSECYRAVESGQSQSTFLSRKLMRIGITFEDDSSMKEVDDIVSMYCNETAMKLDERNREIALRNEGMVNIDLTNIEETPLNYIDAMRFNPTSSKMYVTCPQCLTEIEHSVLESTRTMSDVEKTGVYVKHNPLFCHCGAISILKDEIVEDVKLRLKEKIRSIVNDEEKSRRVATIDISVLNNIPFLAIDGDIKIEEISDADCLNFLRMQQINISGYNKGFYLKYLSNPENSSDRYSILDSGSFDILAISNTSVKECVIGCIVGSPYFTMIRELNRKKEMSNLYVIEYSKLSKMLDYIARDKALKGEESLELAFAIESVNNSLFRLGLGRTKRTIDKDKVSIVTLNKLQSLALEKFNEYKLLHQDCIDSKSTLIKHLCDNASTLFRFSSVKHLNSVDSYYCEFDSVEQAECLISAVGPVVARYNWTLRSMKTLTYSLSSRSRCKLKSTDSYLDVVKSVDKYIPVMDEFDSKAFTMFDSITKMPKELIRLTQAVENQNYYSFIYTIIALKNHTLGGSDLITRISNSIQSIKVSDEEQRVYDLYRNPEKFEQHMSLLALEFKEEEIVEFLSASSFNCRQMRARGGKRTIKTYLNAINELKPHTPEKCILDLHEYKDLVCDLYLINSINNMLNLFKDYHEIVLKQVVRYVDAQYLNYGMVDLVQDLNKYDRFDVSDRMYYNIDLMLKTAEDVYNCSVKHTPLYTHVLAESSDEGSENEGSVENDTFVKMLRAEMAMTPYIEFYLNLYTISEVIESDSNLGSVDGLVPDKYKEVFRKFYGIFNKKKYSDELKSNYGYNEGTFSILIPEFKELMNLIELECNPMVYESFESKVSEFTIL